MTGRCTRWLPGSGGRLKVLNWNLHSFKLLDIIQVLDSISWVRCASGNVYCLGAFFRFGPANIYQLVTRVNQNPLYSVIQSSIDRTEPD